MLIIHITRRMLRLPLLGNHQDIKEVREGLDRDKVNHILGDKEIVELPTSLLSTTSDILLVLLLMCQSVCPLSAVGVEQSHGLFLSAKRKLSAVICFCFLPKIRRQIPGCRMTWT